MDGFRQQNIDHVFNADSEMNLINILAFDEKGLPIFVTVRCLQTQYLSAVKMEICLL